MPKSYYINMEQSALRAIRDYFVMRNNCYISAAYFRDCVKAAIRNVRYARKMLAEYAD
jgi:hypothetical protein